MKRLSLTLVSIMWLQASIAVCLSHAAEIRVQAGASLTDAINNASAGDVLRLDAGRYDGPVIIDKPLTISGEPGAEIAGPGAGTVITIAAHNVMVRGLRVTGSGSSHEKMDSGIKVLKRLRNARILDNRLNNNLVGIDVHGGIDALVRGNVIVGRQDHRMNSRGNGVYIWNAPGTAVEGNMIRFGRDGIFVNTSKDNRFADNRMTDLRFAIHYMYTHSSTVTGNYSANNHAAYALMYSRDLVVTDNVSVGDRDHGIMLNYVNKTRIERNHIASGGSKCLFMYNANKNSIADNLFEYCPIGIHFTAGSQDNQFSGNAFIGNRTQVKYVGSRWLEWSQDKRGNFWSDHSAFDLNADGRADMHYRPNDLMDHVLWTQPAARLLLGSPAVQLIRWSLAAFPSLLPGGVIDSHPLMEPSQQTDNRKGS